MYCPENAHYSQCATACPNTCIDTNSSANCGDKCVEGCTCEKGWLWDNDHCILPDECVCNCQNGGTCIDNNNPQSLCSCPPGYSGNKCEKGKCLGYIAKQYYFIISVNCFLNSFTILSTNISVSGLGIKVDLFT